jgi:hypothetical protein
MCDMWHVINRKWHSKTCGLMGFPDQENHLCDISIKKTVSIMHCVDETGIIPSLQTSNPLFL